MKPDKLPDSILRDVYGHVLQKIHSDIGLGWQLLDDRNQRAEFLFMLTTYFCSLYLRYVQHHAKLSDQKAVESVMDCLKDQFKSETMPPSYEEMFQSRFRE